MRSTRWGDRAASSPGSAVLGRDSATGVDVPSLALHPASGAGAEQREV